MAVTADSVIVELQAKIDKYERDMRRAAGTTDSAMAGVAASTSKADTSFDRLGASAEKNLRRTQNATRNLGRQVSDIGTGLATGQNPFFIIAQQSAQVADALADTGGKAAKVATFFAGPWGAALLAAGSALGILLGRALETGDSVESLTAQLQANSEKARAAEQAQRIFESSLYGAADASAKLNQQLKEQNRTQLQVAQSALAAAEALRQQNIQRLRSEVSRATIARAEVAANQRSTFAGGGVAGAAFTAGQISRNQADSRLSQAQRRVSVAEQALRDAESAVVEAKIPILQIKAAEAADKGAAAQGRYNAELEKTNALFRAGAITSEEYTSRLAAAQRARDASPSGGSRRGGRSGPSAEFSARRVESQRLREIGFDDAFAQKSQALDDLLLTAKGRQVRGIEEAAQAAIAEAESANEKRKLAFIKDANQGRLDALQLEELNAKSDQVAAQAKLTAEVQKQEALARQNAQLAIGEKSAAIAAKEAQLGITDSKSAGLKLQNDILDLRYEERRLQLEYNLAQAKLNKDKVAEAAASASLANLPAQRAAEQRVIDQGALSPIEAYRKRLTDARDPENVQERVEELVVQELDYVRDGISNAIQSKLGVKDPLLAGILDMFIEQVILKPIADAFANSQGGIGGAITSVFGALFGGGRASGGNVAGGTAYLVGENGPELFAPAGSGKIYPTGSLAMAGGNQSRVVQPIIQVDARGAVMNDQFASMILAKANDYSRKASAQAGKQAYMQSPERFGKLQSLGT